MKKTLVVFFVLAFAALGQQNVRGQQIPFLSELHSRYGEFNRLYAEKRRAGANLSAVEPLRKRAEEAFKRGSIPGVLEAISEGQAILAGKKWDERQKFLASLTLETDRLVIEPNQELQVSLTRMFPASVDKTFTATPTVTFVITSGEAASKPAVATASRPPQPPLIVAEHLPIAEASSNAARRLLLPDGVYQITAQIESGGQKIGEIKREIYAIGDFSDSIRQMSATIAGFRTSSDPKVKALAPMIATPAFKLERLAQLNKSRGEGDLKPNQEIDEIASELSAIGKGRNPFTSEHGEVEHAYQSPDGKLVPYRIFVPRSYDGATAKPLVVLLHGPLGDERYFFDGLFDQEIIKGEAERRGYILVGVSGRSRFADYNGPALEDVTEVITAVVRDYKIDGSRVYLLGHSVGGFGAWMVASASPDRFAALAAVSGGPPAQGNALTALLAKVKGIPAMIVHGALDGIAPVQLSKTMSAAAEKAGLKVSYLEFPDGDHLSVVVSTFPAVMDFFDKNAKPSSSK